MTTDRRPARAALALVVLALTACGVTVPTDPDGTLDTVRGGELRAGVSPHVPWTGVGPDGAPTGLEVDLVEEFARSLDAEVVWTDGGEEQLVGHLERGDLDQEVEAP